MDVISQKGVADCGLYCLAYCVFSLQGRPCLCVYSQAEMRVHLIIYMPGKGKFDRIFRRGD